MAPITASMSCPASNGLQFTATGGAVFNIHCSSDYYGGDLGRVDAATFADCLNSCATTQGCLDVAYNGQNCYMKNEFTTARQDDNVWGAVLASAEAAAANRLSCTNGKSNNVVYTSTTGGQFVVQCGADYQGGDLSNLYVNTFEDCLEACDTTSGCIDVALHGNYCYLKKAVTPAVNNPDVWGAKKLDQSCHFGSYQGTSNGYDTYNSAYWTADFTLLERNFGGSFQDCENLCNSYGDQCQYFTYYHPGYPYCEVFHPNTQAQPCQGPSGDFIAGVKHAS